jgi:hypothetical protein
LGMPEHGHGGIPFTSPKDKRFTVSGGQLCPPLILFDKKKKNVNSL